MRNLFNSDAPGGPRNLFNTQIDPEFNEGSGGDRNLFNAPMPVFRPGEVSSAPEPPPRFSEGAERRAAFPAGPPATGAVSDDAREIARENGLPELPPFVNTGGKGDFAYAKTATADGLRELTAKAGTQLSKPRRCPWPSTLRRSRPSSCAMPMRPRMRRRASGRGRKIS